MPGQLGDGLPRRLLDLRRQFAAAAHRRLLARAHHELFDQRFVPKPVRRHAEPATRDAELAQDISESVEVVLEVVVRIAHVRIAPGRHHLCELDGLDTLRRTQRHEALAKEGGERGSPMIEPSSVRRTRAGDLLLFGAKVDTGESRSYRLDRIRTASVARQAFTPRFAIDLTASGPL